MTAHLVSIYVLRDPRDGRARYVGQAVDPQRRLRTHVRQRFYSDAIPTKKPFNLWLQELVRGRLVPDMEVLEEVQGDEAMRRENLWILWYRELGAELFNKNLIGVSFKEYSEGEAAGATGAADVIARREPDVFVIYRLTCRSTGKSYVGRTKVTLDERWRIHVAASRRSRSPISVAIRNYPSEWEREVLTRVTGRWRSIAAERRWILDLSTLAPNGYNGNLPYDWGK